MAPTIAWAQAAVTAVVLLTCGATGTRTHPAVTGTARSDEVQRSRVRILSPQMAHGFRNGISRSPTFRSLVDAINASDGIVYVEHGVCKGGARSCLMGSIIVAASSRILRVRIQKTQLQDKLVVSLGHELQHAIEVLGEPWVTTAAEMRFLFREIGVQYGGMFETREAIRVADAIHLELAATARRGGDTRSP
jgi:hypothetical protein